MMFHDSLNYGQAGESAIAQWLIHRGNCVLPVYEKIIDDGKGPRVYAPQGQIIAPDLLVFSEKRVIWIEAKHKKAFSWHRLSGRWVTGIDLRHYEEYQRIERVSPWPVWLLFLHDGGQAKDSPEESPAGLYGNALSVLTGCENHRSQNWGKSGMVYWWIEKLIRLADET